MEETIARLVQVFIAFGLAYTIALWVALVLWTWRDISSRSTSSIVQIFSTLIVLLFFAPGAVVYLILRPRETLDEAYQRAVAEEYLVQDLEEFSACPACRRPARDDFVFCPYCRIELRRSCDGCGKLVDLRWDACAYCGRSMNRSESVPAAFDAALWDQREDLRSELDEEDQGPATVTGSVSDPAGSADEFAALATNGARDVNRPVLERVRSAPDRAPDSEPRPGE